MTPPIHTLAVLPDRFTIVRLASDAPVPERVMAGPFSSVTRTVDELSVVCREQDSPPGEIAEGGWRCLKVVGPLDFSEVGVLASLAGTLAAAEISIFVLSTFDTDYVLVKEERLAQAIGVLSDAGHLVQG